MYEDDFYCEPSEFEQQVEEFKKSLQKAVRDEYVGEMARLRVENAKLQEIKANFENIKADYAEKTKLSEVSIEKAKKMALIDLLEETKLIMYAPKRKYFKKPKCDKCNSNRQIEYITPLGKRATEECDCKKPATKWIAAEAMRYEFRQNYGRPNKITAWYKLAKEGDRICLDQYSECIRVCDSGKAFEELNAYKAMFKDADSCQKYCDWLNNKEE